MEKTSGRSPHRLVEFTDAADLDRLTIYIYTEQQWDSAQAANYNAFLLEAAQRLADNPLTAPFVPGLNLVRSHVVQWKNARHGHRIFFEETGAGILVLRILHTSMQWPQQLND